MYGASETHTLSLSLSDLSLFRDLREIIIFDFIPFNLFNKEVVLLCPCRCG